MALVRPATPEDADHLAPRLRAADLQEVRAVTRQPPAGVLRGGIAASDPALCVLGDDGAPLAIFGVIPDRLPGSGSVWLLGSDDLVADPLLFLRKSRELLDGLFARYETLRVVVDARNEVHLRWLAWCGFSRTRILERHGVERRPFHELVKTADAHGGT